MFKIWDNKFKYYCLTVYSREQAEIMVKHFYAMDFMFDEKVNDRYRIDEVRD